MALSDKKLALQASLNFATQLREKVDAPPAEVIESSNTIALEGLTYEQTANVAKTSYNQHKNQIGNVHNVDLDTPSQLTIEGDLADLFDEKALPISRYGSLNFLPSNAVNYFESSLDVASGNSPMNIEKDGTLVFLRMGSSGVRDLYYAYVPHFTSRDTTQTVDPVITSKRYRPMGFPANARIYRTIPSHNGVVAGVIVYDNGAPQENFISVTNGTLDDTQHKFLLAGDGITSVTLSSVFRAKEYLYVISRAGGPVSSPNTYTIKRSTNVVSSYVTGDTITWTTLTGFTVVDIQGNSTNGNSSIAFSQRLTTTTQQASSMIDIRSSLTASVTQQSVAPVVFVAPDSNVIRCVHVCSVQITSLLDRPIFPIGYSFTIDLDALTAEIDHTNWPVRFESVSGELVTTNLQYVSNELVHLLWSKETNQTSHVFYRDRVCCINFISGMLNQSIIHDFKLTNSLGSLPSFENVKINNTNVVDELYSVTPHPVTTRAIGGGIRGITMLDISYGIASCYGRTEDGVMEYVGDNNQLAFFRSEITDTTHAYRTDGGLVGTNYWLDFLGAAPMLPRRRISDIGTDPIELLKLIQLSKTDGTIKALGGYFIAGIRNSVPAVVSVSYHVDPMQVIPVTSVSRIYCSDLTLNDIKNQVITNQGLAATHASSTIEFCYIPSSEISGHAVPSFVIVNVKTIDSTVVSILASVAVGTITAPNLVTISGIDLEAIVTTLTTSVNSDTELTIRSGGYWTGPVILHQFNDGYFVGVNSIYQFVNAANIAITTQYRLTWTTETNNTTFDTFHVGVGSPFNSYYWSTPSMGVGEVSNSENVSYLLTRIPFSIFAKSLSEAATWTLPTLYPNDTRIILSTNEPQQFIVDFPDAEPVLILGQEYMLQPTRIDLSLIEADPANKRFFLFVELVNGEAVYVADTTERPDTIDSIYIGYVQTGVSSITSINIEKVTKVAEYRLSKVARGMAIPVSLGNAHEAGALHEDWFEEPLEPLEDVVYVPDLNGLEP